MNFGGALKVLESGGRVAREGWNGKDMWLILIPGQYKRVEAKHRLSVVVPVGDSISKSPYICLKTAQDEFVPWSASQTDVLAKDWEAVL